MKIINFFKKRSVWNWFELGLAVFALVTLILYLLTAKTSTSFVTEYSVEVIVSLVIGLVICAVSFFKDFREAIFVQYLVFLFCGLSFIISLIELFGGLMYGDAAAVLPASFVVIAVLVLVSSIVSLVVAILDKDKKKNKAKVC